MSQTFIYSVCPDSTESEFRSEIGYNVYVFDVLYEERYSAQHLRKVKFRVTSDIGESSYAGFALVLKNQKHQLAVLD